MKIRKRLSILLSAILLIGVISCSRNDPADDLLSVHPRIMLLEGEEEIIRESVNTNPLLKKIHEAIIEESDKIIDAPPVERELIGIRLIYTSQEALHRIFRLSYAYRLTGEDKYFERAEKEMLAASAFSDWNPSHFLDVGEMTMALAIGYDWLYHKLSPESREIIRDAILKKGLEPSFNPDYNWWLDVTHNWNQVCNAGLTFGALAIYEDHPDIAEEIIDRALNTIPLAMEDYKPDGAYPEGYSYWIYGTTYNVMFLSAIDKIWPSRFDYSEHSAFLKTGSFLNNMITPTLDSYNWGDSRIANFNVGMFWFANKNDDPSILWNEKKFLENHEFSRITSYRLFPAIMLWGKDIDFDAIMEPDYNVYVAQGPMPLSIMRTSWNSPDAIYLGFKGGSPSVNHAHMDVGSFLLEADGVRWAIDLDRQDYHSLESRGIEVFGKSQDAERWTVYRLNNYSHNTLTVNGELQRVDGYARIDRYSDDPDFYYGISDISSIYETTMASLVRGAGIVDQEYVVIRDEMKTGTERAAVRWQMVTAADVTITGNNTATLTQDNEQLFIRIDKPAGVKINTWSTKPDTDYDAPNPGTIMVGFEVVIPANTDEILDVKLIPGSARSDAVFDKSLADW